MIIGINCFTHDVASTLIDNNNLLELHEEERYSRKKHHDGFVFGGIPPFVSVDRVVNNYHCDVFAYSKSVEHSGKVTNTLQQKFLEYAHSLDPSQRNTYFYSHHLCHAASAFYSSNFSNSYVCTLDSEGDGLSLCVYIGKNGSLDKVFEVPATSSICKIYSYASELIGLGRRSEGSMLGLAAYGDESDFVDNIIKWTGSCIVVENTQTLELISKKAITFEQKANFAASVQFAFESVVLKLLDDVCVDKSIRNISLAGGGFLNCTLVGKIYNNSRWDDVFVTPLANDAGTALGAALLASESRSKFKFEHTYHGTSFKKSLIQRKLKEWGIKNKEATSEDIAQLLCEGKVGGIFYGKMESGSRALGHRSIIADPTNIKSKNKINIIKKRQPWRPVAPSVLHESGDQWFINYHLSPYMTESFFVKDITIKKAPSIVHINRTARVQSVIDDGGYFYSIIREFHKLTGIPMVCNSSLNIDEPIVQDPADAVKILYTSALDFLFIEGLLIIK